MSDHKRIAKNALFLYFRMFLTMGVGLYTSRLVLEALGIVDYGIYGLVGGIVTLFSFLNSAMASASQRYLSFDIGKNDQEQLKKTFNATVNIHLFIALLVLLLAETIGLWFVNNKLNIPTDRMHAANWVYQFSIFSFLLAIIQVPYNALLFAREHMNVYAYLSIVETFLKLVIVFFLIHWDEDKLIFYAILTFTVSLIIQTSYKLYCKKYFNESVYQFYYDKKYYKELISYSGWNLFGNIAAVARNQGSNILLNIFFGPIVNAAYGLALMVQGITGSFISNIQVAVNPQIVKNFSKGNSDSFLNLVYKSAKFSFFGMLVIVLPVLLQTKFILELWLKVTPSYTIEFIQLALVYSLIETLANPLMSAAQASGKIKWYQIIIGSFIFLTLPIIWIVFKIYPNPISVFWVLIINSFLALFFRVFFLNIILNDFKIKDFIKEVFLNVSLVSVIIYILFYFLTFTNPNTLMDFILQTIQIIVLTLCVVLIFGLNKSEKIFLKKTILNKLNKI